MYYPVEVGDLIRKYGISKTQADQVGWTKLQIIAQHVSKSDAPPPALNEILQLASATKAHNLRGVLRGRKAGATTAVQFNLNDNARAALDKALLAYGAKRTPRGLSRREEALTRIIRAATDRLEQ
jgi:hypothetical protein